MSDGHGHILFCNADLTQGQFFFLFTLSHYWIMWVWGWRNVLFNKMKTHFSRHKCIDGNTQRTPYIPLLSQAPLDTWRYKVIWEFIGPGAASKTFLPFCRPACDTPSESERRKTSQKNPKTKRICLTDAFLPTYEVIPLHVVSKRKIYPSWGHEKCILIERHNSHTQNEVMWWDPVRKRFVMISLCVYNAHRTVVLSGPSGGCGCYES